ncbi:MAG TPA: hypothetical protein VMS92_18985 [Mycobacterium sp.]|nr:hypothetical protein [Mycobacterium sp.]
MKAFARVLSNPDQPDDNTVIETATADEWWDIVWTVPDIVTWLTVEITEDTGTPEVGAHFDGKAFHV